MNDVPKIIIATAIETEFKVIKTNLHDVTSRTSFLDGNCAMYSGRLHTADTKWQVHVLLVGSNSVSAGILLAAAVHRLEPALIIFIGVAGALKEDIAIGDIIIPKTIQFWQAGADKDEIGKKGKKTATFTVRTQDYTVEPNKILYNIARTVTEDKNENWYKYIPKKLRYKDRNIVFGEDIISGFIVKKSDVDTKSFYNTIIKENFDRAVAIETEGFGVLMAGKLLGIDTLVIRGISDRCADKKGSSGQPEVASVASALAFGILEKIDLEELGVTSKPDPNYKGKIAFTSTQTNQRDFGIKMEKLVGRLDRDFPHEEGTIYQGDPEFLHLLKSVQEVNLAGKMSFIGKMEQWYHIEHLPPAPNHVMHIKNAINNLAPNTFEYESAITKLASYAVRYPKFGYFILEVLIAFLRKYRGINLISISSENTIWGILQTEKWYKNKIMPNGLTQIVLDYLFEIYSESPHELIYRFDLSELYLRGANFSSRSLDKIMFNYTCLREGIFTKADFSGCLYDSSTDFKDADLSHAINYTTH